MMNTKEIQKFLNKEKLIINLHLTQSLKHTPLSNNSNKDKSKV